jgi:hypothetical protein
MATIGGGRTMTKKPVNVFSKDDSSEITSVSRLIDKANSLAGSICYRGHEDIKWQLVPTIARLGEIYHAGEAIKVHNLEMQEKLLLHRFRRRSYEHRGRILNDWETLFLARHHSLPVRLLDWTSNPLVALYFASKYQKEKDNTDGAIWWFRRRYRKMNIDVFDQTPPFEYKGIQLVFPYYPTMRMTAQSGIFTIHSPDCWTDLRDLTKDKAKDTKNRLVDIDVGGCWIVPKTSKKEILRHLDRLGINDRTLFPELDGLARGLLQTERFRSPEEFLKESSDED